ncbi:hypothetical protein ACSBOB_11990 [Mesorhizobium sp. ASY16-5R]|uniref:hypothetical protein n=1 Tax=Mesorhizobium sp. ASY16-5R TaxID=3445772 RepID=UPI003FA0A95F
MKYRAAVVLCMAVWLSACFPTVKMPDDTYSFLDISGSNRLLVQPSIAGVVRLGPTQGVGTGIPPSILDGYRAAARRYLDTHGRKHCQIVSVRQHFASEVEVLLKC